MMKVNQRPRPPAIEEFFNGIDEKQMFAMHE
jgi:hypothetical protein